MEGRRRAGAAHVTASIHKKGLAPARHLRCVFCEWGKAAGGAALRGAALRAGGGPGLRGGHPLRPPSPPHTPWWVTPAWLTHTHTHTPTSGHALTLVLFLPLSFSACCSRARFPIPPERTSATTVAPHCPPLLPHQKGTVKRQPAGKHSGEGSLLPFTLRGGGGYFRGKEANFQP